MKNILPEIVFSSSNPSESRRISKLENEGKIRKIAARVYTSNFDDTPEQIVRRNIFFILGNLYPEAILSHRSALEFKPTETDQLFVTYKYTRKTELPGVTIRFLEGMGPIEDDHPISGGLYVSQKERALLENLQVSRKPGPDSKTLTYPEIEDRLEQIIRVNGEDELNKVRDRAREIAEKLGMQREFEKLNKIISALLTTHSSAILTSGVAKARATGLPFDPDRIQLFEVLFHELSHREFRNRPEKNTTTKSYRNFALFESYFSNYIEGTIFEVEEAKQIIQTQQPLPARNDDSHDVLGTYQLVSSLQEMSRTPQSPEELIELLKYRHQVLLSARKDKNPGLFKEVNNYAGQTAFVDFRLVTGTLIKGLELYNALQHPFARASYMMFLVSEVHPFLDGNGRVARVMMNAELTKGKQSKIIIPTVYRDDYMGALRKLTRRREPDAFIRMLERAHEFSATVVGENVKYMQSVLERSNAFEEHTEAKLKIIGQ